MVLFRNTKVIICNFYKVIAVRMSLTICALIRVFFGFTGSSHIKNGEACLSSRCIGYKSNFGESEIV